jgi:hypothetical protein
MAKDYRSLMKERRTQAGRGVPQVDPDDVVLERLQAEPPTSPAPQPERQPSDAGTPELAIEEAPPAEVSEPPRESTRTLERESANAPVAPAMAVRPAVLTPVDTSEKPFNRGFHMYPSRHEQLLDLAYIEKRKPWEIIDQALSEYVKRHHGGKAGK